MDKKKTIIVLSTAIALFSAYYIISFDFVKPGIDQETAVVPEVHSPSPPKIDRTHLKTEYENKFRACLKNYEAVINEQTAEQTELKTSWNIFFEKINGAEEELLNMIVPEDFKVSHLETVLAVSRINDIFQGQDPENFDTAKELLAQVKSINTELIN